MHRMCIWVGMAILLEELAVQAVAGFFTPNLHVTRNVTQLVSLDFGRARAAASCTFAAHPSQRLAFQEEGFAPQQCRPEVPSAAASYSDSQ